MDEGKKVIAPTLHDYFSSCTSVDDNGCQLADTISGLSVFSSHDMNESMNGWRDI